MISKRLMICLTLSVIFFTVVMIVCKMAMMELEEEEAYLQTQDIISSQLESQDSSEEAEIAFDPVFEISSLVYRDVSDVKVFQEVEELETEESEVFIVEEDIVDEEVVDEVDETYVDEETQESEAKSFSTVISVTDSDIELMTKCVMAEAGNQSLDGKILVADVIINRCLDKDFPSTVEEVIKQSGQFESYSNGSISRCIPTDDCYKAVYKELEQRSYPGVLYFRTERFSDYGTPWKQVGDHYFSTK